MSGRVGIVFEESNVDCYVTENYIISGALRGTSKSGGPETCETEKTDFVRRTGGFERGVSQLRCRREESILNCVK